MFNRATALSAMILSALCTVTTDVAGAEIGASKFGKIEVTNASADVSSAVTAALVSEFASAGKFDPGSSKVLTVSLDGYFVRAGNTPAQLRQQGGRDVARGSISLQGDGAGVHRPFLVRMRGDGFENISKTERTADLHKAIAHAVADVVSK